MSSPVASRVPRAAALSVMVALLLLVAPWAASAQPISAPFPVTACPTCTLGEGMVAGAPSGRFLVVWEGSSAQDSRGVLRRLFDTAAAPRGTEALVNRAFGPVQHSAAVAADPRGGYVVVWSEVRPDGGSDVLAQRFRPLGALLGPAIAVDSDPFGTPVQNFLPAIARTPDGGFVVAWVRYVPPGPFGATLGRPQIFARAFTAAGAPLGPPSLLNATLVSGGRPDLCIDSAGRAVVVWTTIDAVRPFEPSFEGVSVRRFSPALGPLSGETIVAQPRASRSPAAVSCGPGNSFVVTWQSDQTPAAAGSDILAQTFSRRDRRIGPTVVVNTVTSGEQRDPVVAHDATGGFFVAWQDVTTSAIDGRRFQANGTPLGGQFQIGSSTGGNVQPTEPDLALAGGRFVVVWHEGKNGLFGRVLSATASAAVMKMAGTAAMEEVDESSEVADEAVEATDTSVP
jgi:large repetitive protein